jgi:hypothetical protein
MRIGRPLGLIAAGFLGGAAAAGALTVPVLSGPYPGSMLDIRILDFLPETDLGSNYMLRVDGMPPVGEICDALTAQFAMSPEKLTEAGFDLRISATLAARDNVLQGVWRRKGWLEKLRTAWFGPTGEDAEIARREMSALRGTIANQLRVADRAMACAGRVKGP